MTAARCPVPVPMWGSEPMRLAILMLGLMPGLAHANPPLTAEAFEAHVTGQTITYRQ